MVLNVEFSLRGEWNAAVKLSLCCEQLSTSVAKEKNTVRPYESQLRTFLFFAGSLNVHLIKIVHALCRIIVVYLY